MKMLPEPRKLLAEKEFCSCSVLIKGSEETRMEKVTELLMAHPSEAPERLVRQTPGGNRSW